MTELATEIESSKSDETVVVRVVRQDAPPVSVSESTSERTLGIPATEWLPTLRKWKVAYRRAGKLHVALRADVEAAIRAGATTARPGPKPAPRPPTEPTEDPRVLLERAGFRRTR